MGSENRSVDPPFFWNAENKRPKPADNNVDNEWDYTPIALISKTSPRDGSRNAARAGLKEGWIRATFIIRENNLKKLKELAYWTRKDLKQVADEAIAAYLAAHESLIDKNKNKTS